MSYRRYSSYTPYSSYSSYDSYSARKSSYYTPRTYDFGTSSYLSNNYGSNDYYTRRYDEYSWKAKDLMTDNPTSDEVTVDRKASTRERYKFDTLTESLDREQLVELEGKKIEEEPKNEKEDTTREDKYSTKDYLSSIYSKKDKDDTREGSNKQSSKIDFLHTTREYDFSKDDSSSKSDDSSDSRNKKYYSRDYSKKDYDLGDSNRKISSEHEVTGDYLIMGSKRNKYNKNKNKNIDNNSNYLQNEKNGSKNENKLDHLGSSVKDVSLHDDKNKTNRKKIYSFENGDDDVFIKQETEKSLQSSGSDSKDRWWNNDTSYKFNQPKHETQKTENHRVEQPKNKGSGDVTDSGPLRMHPQKLARFISAIPDQNRYVSSVKFLPDRIELRFIGAPAKERKIKRCRSITDLYEITVQPDNTDNQPTKPKHPWEETIRCQKQDMAYAYDSENEILRYTKQRHEHTKEMYISQYTHHFDPDEPRTHIAGWKVDVEPNGIPHERSRMCVMKSPVVSDSRRHVPRPKSAPAKLFRSVSPVESVRSQKVEVYERGYSTLPLKKEKEIHQVNQDFFQTSVDESFTEDASSVGYAPSDDTSDSSAFFFNDHHRYYYENNNKDPNFGYNKPRLIRLSAEFPGIRNLEKMRRKRQSMGSYSSGGSRSSVGHSPSPRNGEYGFFVALTSGDPRNPDIKRQQRYSHYY